MRYQSGKEMIKVVLRKKTSPWSGKGRSTYRRWQRTCPASEAGEAVLDMCDQLRLPETIIDDIQACRGNGWTWGYKVEYHEIKDKSRSSRKRAPSRRRSAR